MSRGAQPAPSEATAWSYVSTAVLSDGSAAGAAWHNRAPSLDPWTPPSVIVSGSDRLLVEADVERVVRLVKGAGATVRVVSDVWAARAAEKAGTMATSAAGAA